MSIATAKAQQVPRRWAVIVLTVLGLGLIAAPAIFQMFDRAPKGAVMIKGFKPFMTDARMNSFKRDISQIQKGVQQGDTQVAAFLEGPNGKAKFNSKYSNFAAFVTTWKPINADMNSMLDQIQGQIPDYEAVAALPPFGLFPWFFVIPGVLLVLLGLLALAKPTWWTKLRWGFVALGIGLILAPVAFQMFDRAPKGAKMITAFKTIETRKKVETIQGYFGEIAAGQGSVRLDLIPALQAKGLTEQQIATRFPDIQTLDQQWISTLQNLTPMIGAMSDNVVNYEAVKALPPFTLFPWFFVIPGLMALALAFLAGRRFSAEAETDDQISPPLSNTNPTNHQTQGAS